MSSERAGAKRVIDIGKLVRIEVTPVYPNEDEDASPAWFMVSVWHQIQDRSMTLEEVSKLLQAFGGISNEW